MTLEEFTEALSQVEIEAGANVCDVLANACTPDVTAMYVEGVNASARTIRNRMSNRRIRTQRRTATRVGRRAARRSRAGRSRPAARRRQP